MIVKTRMHVRPNLRTQFFSQMRGDPKNPKYITKPIIIKLWPNLKVYEPRYTKDVLFKLVITEFDDQETYDAFYADDANAKRELDLKEEYYITGVSLTDEIRYFDKDSKDLEDYYTWVLEYTWPEQCFLLRSSWDQELDRFLDEVYKEKPKNDYLRLCLTHRALL